jgi:hypothetical protein
MSRNRVCLPLLTAQETARHVQVFAGGDRSRRPRDKRSDERCVLAGVSGVRLVAPECGQNC